MDLPINQIVLPLRNNEGQFIGGVRHSPLTEFKKGQHWRTSKSYWNKDWLKEEYIYKKKSASQIAKEQKCKTNNILYFLSKHKIKARTMSKIRALKYWGSKGEKNGMYGKRGAMWKGGITPERQAFYNTEEWKKIVSIIWKRDEATCQLCKKTKTNKRQQFHIHHKAFFAIKNLRLRQDNLILLCKKCHLWIHSGKNINGEYLIE